MSEPMTNEDRMMEIEIKLTLQEDLVDALNQMVYQQQKKISELETLCSTLARRIREISPDTAQQIPVDERPPHY